VLQEMQEALKLENLAHWRKVKPEAAQEVGVERYNLQQTRLTVQLWSFEIMSALKNS
jgi:hypothetical protein